MTSIDWKGGLVAFLCPKMDLEVSADWPEKG